MDFCCLPILCGCSNQVSQEGNDPRVCPRCNNVAVQPVKNKQMFELFCVPLCPMSSEHEWRCGICQWSVPRNGGFQPMQPGQFPQQQQFMQPGYQQPQQGYYQQPPMMQGYKAPQ